MKLRTKQIRKGLAWHLRSAIGKRLLYSPMRIETPNPKIARASLAKRLKDFRQKHGSKATRDALITSGKGSNISLGEQHQLRRTGRKLSRKFQ